MVRLGEIKIYFNSYNVPQAKHFQNLRIYGREKKSTSCQIIIIDASVDTYTMTSDIQTDCYDGKRSKIIKPSTATDRYFTASKIEERAQHCVVVESG